MDIATLAQRYLERFKHHHGASATQPQWAALNAIIGCRTAQYGQLHLACDPCATHDTRYLS